MAGGRARLAPMRPALSAFACAVLAACASPPPPAPKPVIDTSDVARFYSVYDAAGGRPTAEALDRDYLGPGSEGLHALARLRGVTGARIAEAIEADPAVYESARACAGVLPQVKTRLEASLANLATYVPEADFPAVTIVVGRTRPVGIGSPETGVQIGLEALCAASFLNPDLEDRFVYIITHEYVHTLQPAGLSEREGATVLEVSLEEGIAEFVTELVAGEVSYSHLHRAVSGREYEIESAFAAELDQTDLSNWVYNMGKHEPADLGYWTGYRIAKAYYDRAPDKRAAVREMLDVSDAAAFLAASGWVPAD